MSSISRTARYLSDEKARGTLDFGVFEKRAGEVLAGLKEAVYEMSGDTLKTKTLAKKGLRV